MATGSASPSTVALTVVPIEWPIWRVVSSIPEAKLRFSGSEFITVALLGELNMLDPTAIGNNSTGNQ